ncbi:uncharacterized protein [Amphiura filiformis]|uniref:uncharacterized protein n=1 Tax=Amphiura filiformis TaxID=82378 RepID=UPI003B20FED8
MVKTCVVPGCDRENVFSSIGLGFYRIPAPRFASRRRAWCNAIFKGNGLAKAQQLSDVRVCGLHFQTGKPNSNPHNVDYIPNVFNSTTQQCSGPELDAIEGLLGLQSETVPVTSSKSREQELEEANESLNNEVRSLRCELKSAQDKLQKVTFNSNAIMNNNQQTKFYTGLPTFQLFIFILILLHRL